MRTILAIWSKCGPSPQLQTFFQPLFKWVIHPWLLKGAQGKRSFGTVLGQGKQAAIEGCVSNLPFILRLLCVANILKCIFVVCWKSCNFEVVRRSREEILRLAASPFSQLPPQDWVKFPLHLGLEAFLLSAGECGSKSSTSSDPWSSKKGGERSWGWIQLIQEGCREKDQERGGFHSSNGNKVWWFLQEGHPKVFLHALSEKVS